ncbi:MAG: NAD(P)/FAD-dependent oxidoreductase [Kiloniellaceae bacterium]
MTRCYDTVIVGGGVVGCSIAYNLARLARQRILLLERNTICSGDTAMSCAIVRTHYSNPLTCRMARIGRDILADFGERVGGTSGFTPCGYLIFTDADTLNDFEANIRLQQAAGAEVELIDTRQALDLHPLLNPTRIAEAAFEPLSGFADPHLTTTNYATAARRLGVEIRQGVRVRRLLEVGGRIGGVETDEGVVPAQTVVVATGVWTNAITATAGVHYPYEITGHKVVHFRFHEDYTSDRFPVVRDLPGVCYNRPQSGGMLFGDSHRGGNVPDPDALDESLPRDGAGRFLRNFENCFRGLTGARISSHWAGRYDVSPDSNPLIGGFPGKEGLIAVCGLSGGGFKLAPCIGQMVAEQIALGESRVLPIEPYRPTRFDDGAPFRKAYTGTGAMA